MIRSVYRTSDGAVRTDVDVETIETALADSKGVLWIDLVNEPPVSSEPLLRDVFGFHPLAVEDALEKTHVPRVDDWETYLYLVLHTVAFDAEAEEPLRSAELDIFLGRNYLVTYRSDSVAAVDGVWTAIGRDERHLQRGAGYLLYRLIEELAAQTVPVVEEIDDAIDSIEDQIFRDPTSSTLQQIFTVKRALLRLRRIIGPQRETLNKLTRGDYRVIGAEDRVFFRDVYDHLVRLHEMVESLRDLIGSAMDTYLSVVNNRMNEVMKTLTVITTLFMPLTFLAGFFGMNFFQPPTGLEVWTGHPAFLLTLGGMIGSGVGMYLWMRKRGWT